MRQCVPFVLGKEPHEVAFDRFGRRFTSPSEALCDALHVRVHDDALRAAESHTQDDVCSLAADAGQSDELSERIGHSAAVYLDEPARETDQILRLLPEHAEAGDHTLYRTDFGFRQRSGRWPAGEELRRHLVDCHVGCLGTEYGCAEELIGIVMYERAVRVGVESPEPHECSWRFAQGA